MKRQLPTAIEVTETRARIDVTQSGLAALIGVHPMTISKWERSEAMPSPWQRALMRRMQKATGTTLHIKEHGAISTLITLLK